MPFWAGEAVCGYCIRDDASDDVLSLLHAYLALNVLVSGVVRPQLEFKHTARPEGVMSVALCTERHCGNRYIK